MSLLNWIRAAVIALLVAAVSAVKVLAARNTKLKEDLEKRERQLVVRNQQDTAKKEIVEDEDKVISNLKDNTGKSRADKLNSVLNDTSA